MLELEFIEKTTIMSIQMKGINKHETSTSDHIHEDNGDQQNIDEITILPNIQNFH